MIVNWSLVNNLTGVFQAANTASNNTFWIGMLFMLFVVLIAVLLVYGLETAILTSAFISLILGLLMSYAELISWESNLIFLAIVLAMFLYINYTSSRARS